MNVGACDDSLKGEQNGCCEYRFEKDYPKEKSRYLTIAKGSLGELKTQADIGVEVGFINRCVGEKWMEEAETLSKMIGKLILKINNY